MCQLVATLCVALFLALFALGGSDPTSRVCLRTLSFAGPSTIMGPVWDTVVVPRGIVAGTKCEACILGLHYPLLPIVRAEPLTSSVVTLWGYKS
jgi:hypothetical protein